MSDRDEEDPRETTIRTVSSVRRNGWNRATIAEALHVLDARTADAGHAESPADDLAREFVRSLLENPLVLRHLPPRRNLPIVPKQLERVASILVGSPESALVTLRAYYNDPTDLLIALVNDLDESERNHGGVPAPHAAAIMALGQVGTLAATRCLFDCFRWASEAVQVRVIDALGATTHLIEHTVSLWTSMSGYARWAVVEELARREVRDERVFSLLIGWLDSGDDLERAACALGSYPDPRCVPHLRGAIDRLLDRGQPGVVTEVIDYLADYGAAPTDEQLQRHARMLKQGDLN